MIEKRMAQQARERITGAQSRLRELNRAVQEAARAAQTYQDRDLSPEGLGRRRHQMVEAAKAKFAPQLEQLRAQVAGDQDTLARYAAQNRPQLGDTAVDLQRAQMAWDGVRGRLDAGMSMRQVLDGATLHEALAISEWGPAYLEAESFKARGNSMHAEMTHQPRNLDAFHNSVQDRLAELGGAEAAWARSAHREASGIEAAFVPIADHAGATLLGAGGSDGAMLAAIESIVAAQMAGASLGEGDGGDAA